MKRSIDEENSQNMQEETAPRKLCRTSPVILSQNSGSGSDNSSRSRSSGSDNSSSSRSSGSDNSSSSSNSDSSSDNDDRLNESLNGDILNDSSNDSTSDLSLTRSVSSIETSSLSMQDRDFLDRYVDTLAQSSTFMPSEIENEVIRNGFSTILSSNIKDYTLFTTEDGEEEYKACLTSNKFVNFNEISYICNLCVCLTVGSSVHVSVQYNIPDLRAKGELSVFWMNEETGEHEMERYLRQRTMLVSKEIRVRHWLFFSRTETLQYFEISPELSDNANSVRTHLSNILSL